MATILYFTDSHVEPDTDLSRFSALGNLIVSERPDIILQGGDFASFGSLSHWDKDKRKLMEHRRYTKDVSAMNLAVNLMFQPLRALQRKDKKNKHKQYKPELVWLEGNHEYWVEQYIEYNPTLEGSIGYKKDINIPEKSFRNYTFVPYRSPKETSIHSIDGVAFTHVPRGRAGPISSKYLGDRALAEVFECNAVFGHTHRLTVASLARVGSKGEIIKRTAINGGCFFEKTPTYAVNNTNDYWQGVLMLETYGDGQIRIKEEYPLDLLKERYAEGRKVT